MKDFKYLVHQEGFISISDTEIKPERFLLKVIEVKVLKFNCKTV